jgi:hypothetical protein
MDNRINDVEVKLQDQIEGLDKKYNVLKEQLAKFTKIFEDEKFQKDNNKNKQNDELKNFENKVKNMLMEERKVKYLKIYLKIKNFLNIANPKFC